MEEKTKEALYYLAAEIGRLSAYIGHIRNEGSFLELVDSEIDSRTEKIAKILGERFIN